MVLVCQWRRGREGSSCGFPVNRHAAVQLDPHNAAGPDGLLTAFSRTLSCAMYCIVSMTMAVNDSNAALQGTHFLKEVETTLFLNASRLASCVYARAYPAGSKSSNGLPAPAAPLAGYGQCTSISDMDPQ